MSPQDFERRWNTGLRSHLSKIAQQYLPPDEAEEAVSVVFIRLWKRVSDLPEEGQDGFQFGKFCRYQLKLAAMQQHAKSARRAVTMPLLYEVDGESREQAAVMRKAQEVHSEAQRQREGQYRAAEILQAVRSPENRRILSAVAQGMTQQQIGEKLGVSKQAVSARYRQAVAQARERLQVAA